MKEINYTLVRRKRKTVGITVSKDGVKVSAPYLVSKKEIDRIVQGKSSWILRKLEDLVCEERDKIGKDFSNGSVFPYLGKDYTLKIIESAAVKKTIFSLEDPYIIATIPSATNPEERSEKIRAGLVKWYKDQARAYILPRIQSYAEQLKVSPARVAIKGQKKRWGSCSSKGNININWKIMMTLPSVIDYLIVHELVHLKEMNHSKKFWQWVESTLPRYKVNAQWLKKHGGKYIGF